MSKELDLKSIKGLTQDSRRVKKGYLFAALAGSKTDGRKYIQSAIQNGARFVLAPQGTVLPPETPNDVQLILSDDPRHDFSLLVAEFYKKQPNYIAAVTGTNGKSSTVFFAKQLWKMQGLKAASYGTLGLYAPSGQKSGSMTTPDPETLYAELADLAAVGVTHLAIEASSHGLDQSRLDGLNIKAAGFTNLSHDHLDYHASLEEYCLAKSLLFSKVMQRGGSAVINADSDYYEFMKDKAKTAGHKIISTGFKANDLKILKINPAPQGQDVILEVFGKTYEVTIPLVGVFQVKNTLTALGLILAEGGLQQDTYVMGLEKLQGAPGRLELIANHPKDAAVYVDHAHTPAALESVLKALREHTSGHLVCVFGCGGDRDRSKRQIMGAIAEQLADRVIITDDNPRSENPSSIRNAIKEGAPNALEIADRGEAITYAIQSLKDGDVLVIAGKGHEKGQVYGDESLPFDDCEEAKKVIEGLK